MKLFERIEKPKLKQDDVFLHYTGNMFGIGCSAFSKRAIDKITSLKKRSKGSNYIALIPHISWLNKFGVVVTKKIRRLMQQFWPGNLTIILPTTDERFKYIGKHNKVAFRIPSDKILREFIDEMGIPIISTSINVSGESAMQDLQQIKQLDWFDFSLIPPQKKYVSNEPSTIIDDFSCIREGSIPFSIIEKAYNKPHVLFVCTANICRSPIAEYYFREQIDNTQYTVSSAGFLQSGVPISANSQRVLQENNLPCNSHLSTQIDSDIVLNSWLILTMTDQHKKKLKQFFPNAANKVFTLLEYADINGDVEDPYMQDIEQYRLTYAIIANAIDKITKRLDKEDK